MVCKSVINIFIIFLRLLILKTLDGVAKVIHQQLCDVVDTLNTLKAEQAEIEIKTEPVTEPKEEAPKEVVSEPVTEPKEVSEESVAIPELVKLKEPIEPKTSKKNKKSKSAKKKARKIVEDATQPSVQEHLRDQSTPVPEPVKTTESESVVVIETEPMTVAVSKSAPKPVTVAEPECVALDTVAKTKDAVCTKMENMAISGGQVGEVAGRLTKVEAENAQLKSLLTCLEARLVKLEGGAAPAAAKKPEPVKAAAPAPAKKEEEDDDDFDMFGDEEDDEEVAKRNAERVAAYHAKKAAKGKPAVIAKSSILLDCKPWDDETNMKELEEKVRSIQMDGLVWGASKLIPVAYGLKKLQIGCVIEDDKVSTEALEEKICEFEDHCQSVDIAAFNKI